jgi:hypothetical protein
MIPFIVRLKKQLDDLPRGSTIAVPYDHLFESIAPKETIPKRQLANMTRHFARSSHCNVDFTAHDGAGLVEFSKLA